MGRRREGRLLYKYKLLWMNHSLMYSTWEPEENILDARLIAAFEQRERERELYGPKKRGPKPKTFLLKVSAEYCVCRGGRAVSPPATGSERSQSRSWSRARPWAREFSDSVLRTQIRHMKFNHFPLFDKSARMPTASLGSSSEGVGGGRKPETALGGNDPGPSCAKPPARDLPLPSDPLPPYLSGAPRYGNNLVSAKAAIAATPDRASTCRRDPPSPNPSLPPGESLSPAVPDWREAEALDLSIPPESAAGRRSPPPGSRSPPSDPEQEVSDWRPEMSPCSNVVVTDVTTNLLTVTIKEFCNANDFVKPANGNK
uniref:Chromobox 6 n=1 Tax=Callorhinchus milii TaxID=7868 RepID=A0A4W3J436_CALMI